MKKIKFLLLIIFTILCINQMNIVKAEELPDNGARISSAQIIQTKTGTGPFDADDNPGNDSSENNNIVRSFDQVTWTIENTMALKEGSASSYTGGKIYFEATLPESLNNEISKWDLSSMQWIEEANVSDDGRILTGYYQMGKDVTTIPGKQTLVFVLSILGAPNGLEFNPTIKLWLNGNEETDKIVITPETIKVSAVPRYNVKLLPNGYLANKVTVNYGEGDTLGRMYGYGLLIQLYNDNQSKGLKGIEYPTGDITFDVDMQLLRTLFGSKDTEDITSECTPVLWNYKVNNLSDYGVIPNRIMKFGNTYSKYISTMPMGIIRNERRYCVYNSGKYTITQNGNKLSVTIRDYEIDGTFPIWNYLYESALGTTTVYPSNIGCFSVGYFEIFVPDNEASTVGDRNYYLRLNTNNFSATSNSGIKTTEQMVTTDDSTNTQHVLYKPGVYSQAMYVLDDEGNSNIEASYNDTGKGAMALGQNFELLLKFTMSTTNDSDIYSASKFVKFDGEAFEPRTFDDGTKYYKKFFEGDMEFKIWYAAKPDGTNWTSPTEMIDANVEDLILYENVEDIPQGVICIGEYIESTTGYLSRVTGDNNCVVIPLKVRETAKIGQTYGFIQRTKVWMESLDRNIYTITNKDVTLPTPTWDFGNKNYIKTEYDEEGNVINGTNSGGRVYGNTLLIIGADLRVQKIALDENGNEKVNYDISKNDYDITYKITPILDKISTVPIEIKDITVQIKDILPDGLEYVSGSCEYGDPEITKNSDGTTTLIWYIYNCKVGEAIAPIYYKAHIDESTPNGTQYTNTVIISADAEKVGNTYIDKRTVTYTNQIINLASHRLYKITSTPVIENNGDIHYTISYKNNTDSMIPDFQLLDILPYNGDNRGTSYNGTYKLDRIVITQRDANGKKLSNDNLTVTYTDDSNVRNTITCKDENLGDNWKKVTSESIKQYATALSVKGEMTPQVTLNVDIYLTTENNKTLDKYVNSATVQTYKETEEITTSNVVSQVVERKIEGLVWEDVNANGIKDNNEPVIPNIEMILLNEEGKQVTDVYGNVVTSVNTNEKGEYSFKNLPRGNYYVKVNISDDKYELTQKEVGTNTEINSKFNIDTKETDKITKLDSIDLVQITASHINAGLIRKPASVITKYVDIDTNEEIYDESKIEGKVDDKYSTIDEIDNINAKYEDKYEFVKDTGNTSGNMTIDQIEVIYYYQKKSTNVIVKYVDIDTEEELLISEEILGKIDEKYTTKDKIDEINQKHSPLKYVLVKTTDNTEGNMTLNTIEVIYYYKKVEAQVIVKHLDENTNEEIADREYLGGFVGEEYTTQPKEIDGYELVERKIPKNKDGLFEENIIEVIYYYNKKVEPPMTGDINILLLITIIAISIYGIIKVKKYCK